MAIRIIKKYINMSYEDRKWLNTNIAVLFTTFVVIGKMIAAAFGGFFFFVSGVVSICMLMARYFCIRGNSEPNPDIRKYNITIGSFVAMAGVLYSIYMGRLLISSVNTMQYVIPVGVAISIIAAVEFIVAVVNNIRTDEDSVFLKHTKKINLCLALTAISLAEVAILSFLEMPNSRQIGAYFGITIGMIIIFAGGYIIFCRSISLCGNEENDYVRREGFSRLESGTLNILLFTSKIFPPIIYFGEIKDGECHGRVTKGPTPLFKLNKALLAVIFLTSPVLVIPYMAGVFVLTFRHHRLLSQLDEEMYKRGFERKAEEIKK